MEATEKTPLRYKFEVGEDIIYETTSTSHWIESDKWRESRSEITLRILEEMENSWRTLILTRSWEVGEKASPPRTTVIEVLIHPDGRLSFANEQRRRDSIYGAAYLIPRLPDETLKKGLRWKGNVSITGYWNEYSFEGWENVEFSGLARISFLRHSPGKMDEIYKEKSSGNVWFDVSNGRFEKAETRYSQGWGIASEGSSETILKETKKHDSAWVEDKQRETQAYWAAKDEADAAMSVEAQSEAEVEGQLSAAKAAWQKFLDKHEHGVLVELARSKMEDYERRKDYYVKDAFSRANVLGYPSPDWTLEDFSGESVTLSSLRGNVVLLDFWYRGCGWCIMAAPQLEQVYKHFRGKPVVMFGMNTDKNKEDALEAIRILDLPYNHLQAESVVESYGRFGFPTFIIIDKTGIVRSMHVGWDESLAEKIITDVEKLLSEGRGSMRQSMHLKHKLTYIESLPAPEGLAFRHTASKDEALYVFARPSEPREDIEGEVLVYDSTRISDGVVFQTTVPSSFGYPPVPMVLGDYLYIGGTGITLFDISEPLQLIRIGEALPELRIRDMTLLEDRLVTIGRETIAVIDVSSQNAPVLVRENRREGSYFFSIGAGEAHLFISELGEFGTREGFGVYKVLDSDQVVEESFIIEDNAPYHFFYHSGSLITTGDDEVIKIYQPNIDWSLTEVREIFTEGARAATLFTFHDSTYLLVNSWLYRIIDSDIQRVASFAPRRAHQGSGFPFRPVVFGGKAFIPGDDGVDVYRLEIGYFPRRTGLRL